MSTTTYPLATLAATVSSTGISAPALADIINSEVASYEGIYGSDAYLTEDTQDYQLIAVRSTAIRDVNDLAIAVYNSFLPTYAQGTGLAAIVAINGLKKKSGTNSTAVLTITGTVGTIITNGQAKDTNGNLWNLPASVTIPDSGEISVTATAATAGAITAAAGTITKVYTIGDGGWQTVTNPAAATVGTAVESDAQLRTRQAASTALSSQTPADSILAAVANISGVGRYALYENSTNATDTNGVPSHSIAVVVEGGDVAAIAATIAEKKAPGTGTYGTTIQTYTDSYGNPTIINFFELTEVPIFVGVTIKALNGYASTTVATIQSTLSAFIEALDIGVDVYINQLIGAASLSSSALGATFVITSLTAGTSSGSLAAADVAIAFNAAAQCSTANVTVTVVS